MVFITIYAVSIDNYLVVRAGGQINDILFYSSLMSKNSISGVSL